MAEGGNPNSNPNIENDKVALLGSSDVGKTCIIKRYTDNIFDENS